MAEAAGSVRGSRGWTAPQRRPSRPDAGNAALAFKALELRHRVIAKGPDLAELTCKGKRLGRHARPWTPLRYGNSREEARGRGRDAWEDSV